MRKSTIVSSIIAGMMIGLACVLFVNQAYSVVSAFLFAFALYFICENGWKLYTGQIAYMPKGILTILLGNLIGTGLVVLGFGLTCPTLSEAARALIDSKIENLNIISALFKSMACGFMMYLAVNSWKKGNKLGVFIAIPVFILAGFEHSIADFGYWVLAGCPVKFIGDLIVILFGNSVGSILLNVLNKSVKD